MPPIAARAASRRPSDASAGTAVLVSCSTTPVVARAPSTLSPIEMPWSLEVRGISDGSSANRAATVSSGAAGDATTGFCHLASRKAWSRHRIPPNAAVSRRITMPPRAGRPHEQPARRKGEPSSLFGDEFVVGHPDAAGLPCWNTHPYRPCHDQAACMVGAAA